MKTILHLLFLLLILFIGIIITGVFLPPDMSVSASTEINAKPEIIFPEINNFSKWKYWSPWQQSDSTMKVSILKGNSKESRMVWESGKFGECRIIFTHQEPNSSVAANFDFGTNSKTTSVWFIENVATSTLVNWSFTTKELTIWEKYFALIHRSEIKELLALGLKKLKMHCEDLKFSRVGPIEIINSDQIPAVIMVDSVLESQVEERLSEMDAYLLRFFGRREMRPAGKPFVIRYGVVNDSLFKIARGYPMNERTWVWRTLQYFSMTGGKKVTASHFGSNSTDKAHNAIREYISKNNLEINGQYWEIELFTPEIDKDSTLWETRLFYPIN